jgi:histidinol-phosphatase
VTSRLAQDLELALRASDVADELSMRAFEQVSLEVTTKADRTPVTEADRAVESAIRDLLKAERPSDAVVGEEHGVSGGGPRRWIVDPIDGTKNFVRHLPVWATLIALEQEERVVVGVVSAPALGRRWWAARGLGAWAGPCASACDPALAAPDSLVQPAAAWMGRPGAPISVSGVSDLAQAHLSGNALSYWRSRGGPGPYIDLALRCYADRCFGDFWSHVLVAEGLVDIGVDPEASLWDLAALEVIVEEAGGRFSDLEGRPGVRGGSALSTNGLLHPAALEVLSGRGSPL